MIFSLHTKTILSSSVVGGKARALIELTNAGFPIPEGWVLPVEFFSSWLQTILSSSLWKHTINNLSIENCQRIISNASNLNFTSSMCQELCNLSLHMENSRFAIRSSSPEEDLANKSFAGMYSTFLGISYAEIEKYVAKTFASVFDYRVLSYKKKIGISIHNPQIAVIIQKQISSETSGIGFSINLHTNCYDETLINASFGLGETVVSGKVTPDEYVVNSFSNQILLKKIGDKKEGLYLHPNGKTALRTCDKNSQNSLTDHQIKEVACWIKKCEQFFNFPVDIEWTYSQNVFYLLQCRPITSYFPLYPEFITNIGERKELYFDIIKASQGFETSMSTLGCELFADLINIAKQGFMPVGKNGLVYHAHGRMVMQLGNTAKVYGKKRVPAILGAMNMQSAKMVSKLPLSKYMPSKKPSCMKSLIQLSWMLIKKGFIPFIRFKFFFQQSLQEFFDFTEQAFTSLKEMKGSTDDFSEQVRQIYSMYDDFVTRVMPLMISMTGTASLQKLFKGKNVEEEILRMNMNLKGNPTSEMGYHQLQLASFSEFQNCNSFEEFAAKIHSRDFSEDFLVCYDRYIDKYGCRGIGEIDIQSPRIREDIQRLYTLLSQIRVKDNAVTRGLEKKKIAFHKLQMLARKIGKEKAFYRIITQLEWAGLREYPKYMYVFGVDILRSNVLSIAEEFVKNGQLDEPEDIFYLTKHSISNAQKESSLKLQPFVKEEKRIRSHTNNVSSWPILFDSRGTCFNPLQETQKGEIIGNPISPGVVQGSVKVMHQPFEKKLESGEILVTASTEPSWTPIFMNARGVVMEIGGILQHGAIIAREYGIPCVAGINNATQWLRDGDVIVVDGSRGTVRKISPEEKL